MDPVARLLAVCVWVGIGALIGWRSGRRGTGMIWALVFGPLGILLFTYGEWRRSKVPPEPEPLTTGEHLNVPVEVRVEGTWMPGVLQTWTQGDEGWHGWVSYMADGDWAGDWFAAENVRRTIRNEPGQH